MLGSNVLRGNVALSKQVVSAKLRQAWARILSNPEVLRKNAFADAIGVETVATVDNALKGKTLPELHTALNSLFVDATALDEVFAEYGFRLVPISRAAANDLQTVTSLCDAAGELSRALADGQRDHNETIRVADKLRVLLPAAQQIVREADELRELRA